MKDEGIPSGCEEDLNALMAMLIMQYAANRPAFMGNPNPVSYTHLDVYKRQLQLYLVSC